MASRYHPDLPASRDTSLYEYSSLPRRKARGFHTPAGNGASRRGLQARIGRSACNFEVIFNANAALVSQPRQLSVVVLRVYSSSTTSFVFCGPGNSLAVLKLLCFVFG